MNKSCVAACLESVRMAVESVSGCAWNECPDQRGITVRMCVEWVSESAWNPHLKLQGKTDTGPNRGVLYRCLARLTATAIEISDGKRSYTGSLIDEFYRDEETGELVIELNPKLTGLFGREGFTHIDWSVRRRLTHKPLSQWLHGYFASHADPFPVSIKTLMNMAGSDDACPASAERNLKRALAALAEAHQSLEQPFSYEIREGKVYVHKRPTGSQHRHLRKKLGRQNLAD